MNTPKKIKKSQKRSPYRKAEWMEFVKFTAFPRVMRSKEFGFQTDSLFAKKYKINPATVSEWKQTDDFWNEVKKTWKLWGKDRTPDVIMGLYRTAVNQGRAAEALAWMKIVEDWSEKIDMQISKRKYQDLSNAELAQLEKTLKDFLLKK